MGAYGRFGMAIALLLVSSTAAFSIDDGFDAAKLKLKRTGSGIELLKFFGKGGSLPMPGTINDPTTSSPGGTLIELFSAAHPEGVALVLPRDGGTPGWTTATGSRTTYKFLNPGAPNAFSDVKRANLRVGSSI